MADIKISELTQVSALNNGDLVEVSQVNALAPSGYTSLKASMTDLGKKVNSDIEYTTDLADFTDKTTLGAIKETAKGKNIADEYDGTQTYDNGDVVIYKNTLYICTTNNTTGAWDATKWTATTVQSLIGDLSQLTTTDKSSLVGAVNEIARYTPVYGNTASGAIATFDTSLALPLQDCTIDINAVQSGSGTPSPDNARPITGFSSAVITKVGKNLLPNSHFNTNLSGSTFINITSDFIIPKTGATITVSGKTADGIVLNTSNCAVNFYNSSNTNIFAISPTQTKTVPDLSDVTKIVIFTTEAVANKEIFLQIEYGSTATDYEPYNSETKTIDFNGNTVYGGLLDVTSGVLTVTHGYIDLGSLTQWNKNTSFTNTLFVANVSDKKTNNSNCLCTNYINGGIATGGTFLNNMQNNNFASDTSNGIYIRDDSKASLSGDDFKTAMSGVYLVYELATPQTYQLTPTQISAIVGTNNVFTDTNGNTSVMYACSLKDYIDSQ